MKRSSPLVTGQQNSLAEWSSVARAVRAYPTVQVVPNRDQAEHGPLRCNRREFLLRTEWVNPLSPSCVLVRGVRLGGVGGIDDESLHGCFHLASSVESGRSEVLALSITHSTGPNSQAECAGSTSDLPGLFGP
jgi:hypothetical protein